MDNVEPFALRAVLKKDGKPDIALELRRSSPIDFDVIENANPVAVYYRIMTPPNRRRPGAQMIGGEFLGLYEAWQGCVAKNYEGYMVANLEEGTRI